MRTRSHAHGVFHGRVLVHLVVVAIAVAAIAFATQYPVTSSAIGPSIVPDFAVSGVSGTVRPQAQERYLSAGTSLRTLDSVQRLTARQDVASIRTTGGVSPSASVSSGVSAAAASSGVQGAGVTSLADIIDPTKPFAEHVTGPGETLNQIAARYGVDIGTILDNNPTVTDSNLLTLGLVLIVPRADGILHKVALGETLASIVGEYDNITVETAMAFRSNAIADPDNLESGSFVLLPGATKKPPPPPPPEPTPAPAPPAAPPSAGSGSSGGGSYSPPPSSGGRFSNPLAAYLRISDPFGTNRGPGRIHEGIDLDLYGYWSSPVFSACDGVVSRTEWLTYSYGYYVVVDCGDGWTTLYAHFSRIDVAVGQQVSQGTVVGLSGVTGFTTGEHLHFEIRYFGAPVNPHNYIPF